MSEHGWTRHGHRCCDQATGPRPPGGVARCGGPGLCGNCYADAAIRHSPGSGTFAAPTSPSEPAAKITELIAESSLGAALATDAVYQRGFDHGRRRAAEDVAKLIDAFNDDTRDILLKAARVALNGPGDALSVSVEPVPPTPRVIGYIVVIQDSTGHWCDDWDGEVHETLEKGLTALAEARESGDGFHAKLGLLTEVEETNDAD